MTSYPPGSHGMLELEKIPSVVIDTHIWVWQAAGDRRVEKLRKYRGRQILPAICVWGGVDAGSERATKVEA